MEGVLAKMDLEKASPVVSPIIRPTLSGTSEDVHRRRNCEDQGENGLDGDIFEEGGE